MSSEPFLFSQIPAKWVDQLIIPTPRTPLIVKGAKAVLSRAISTLVFPLFTSIDLATYGCRSLFEWSWSKFSKDPIHLDRAQRCSQIAKKSLVGVISSPLGMLGIPDLVTRPYLCARSRENLIEPYGKLYTAIGQEKHPETIAQVQEIVQMARQEKKQISISGERFSQGKHVLPTDPSNYILNMNNLNQVRVDPTTKTAKVQAGATWKDVQEVANEHGLAVRVMQASNVFSIGGSLSANCHGWDHTAGALGNTVLSLTIIDAQGELQTLKPEDELFKLVLGGYGLFGIIVEAEISLIENQNLLEWGEEVAPKDYAEYFKRHIIPSEDVVMHLYRLSLNPKHLLQTGVAVSYSSFKTGFTPTASDLWDEQDGGSRIERILLQLARNLSFIRSLYWIKEKKNMLHDKRITRNELMRAPIQAAFNQSHADAEWLQEYFVKAEELGPFLEVLGGILQTNKVRLLNATVRYVKRDESAEMAYAKNGDRFAVVLYFTQTLSTEEIQKTKRWVRKVIDYLTIHDGTYYLPYQHFAKKNQFKQCYPQWKHVLNCKKKYDPEGLFGNGFFADYFKPKNSGA